MKKLVIHTDGCSKGNPGPAGIGFLVYQDDSLHPVFVFSNHIGVATNNQAEYRALVAALEYAINLKADIVEIRSDSELIVNQMNGAYRVRKAELIPLYEKAKRPSGLISNFDISHVPREQNREADELANKGLKRA